MNTTQNLQLVYLGMSLFSSVCVMTNLFVVPCCNIVGFMCLLDFYFVKKKDMILHHILIMTMLHYMNNHDSEYKKDIVFVVLSTEISTIFLITHNLLDNACNIVVLKNINKLFFISSFVYYRIYNYSYLLLDNNIYNTLYIHSKNNFEYYEIFASLYGLFFLNLYWTCLILKKCIK
jgi:hypothetical protein